MRSIFTILLAVSFFFETQAQLSPQDAVKAIGRAVNMGNTLDPPNGETTWNNPVVLESHFDDYKNAGFTCVRIPVTWDKHTATTLPFKIDATWMARVEQIVDWGLSRNLVIILNAHHDAWIKDNYNAANAQRFDSIWSQIATRFKGKTDRLIFEILNEPNPMAEANVNLINAQTLKTIRKTNPTRNVVFSGYKWSNAEELVTVAIPNDPYLIGNYHSYDPYPFGLEGTGTYGSDADIQATKDRFTKVANWSIRRNKEGRIQLAYGMFRYSSRPSGSQRFRLCSLGRRWRFQILQPQRT
jgi:aryl-phospho-beta-D-glucosidase BglC (GH1 family)